MSPPGASGCARETPRPEASPPSAGTLHSLHAITYVSITASILYRDHSGTVVGGVRGEVTNVVPGASVRTLTDGAPPATADLSRTELYVRDYP